MRKCLIIILTGMFSLVCRAQLPEGSIAPNFSATDTQGQQWNLYDMLNEGKPVILHFFATWDNFSWNYLQSGQMQELINTYGPLGTGELNVLSIEAEPGNSLLQLQGPEFISGDLTTQTYGDWLTGNPVPVIDSSELAILYGLNYLPAVFIICPDGVLSTTGEISASEIHEQALQTACPALTEGLDPALLNPAIHRVCGSTEVELEVVIKNLGTSTLSAAQIELMSVGGTNSFEWNGDLEAYHSDTITIDGIQLLNDEPVKVFISTTNDNFNNDTVSAFSEVGLSALHLQLELSLDNYPDEISWEIRNAEDSIVVYGGDYVVSYEYINQFFTLPEVGCYSFYLYDSEGDGLHGGQWGGYDGSCYLRSIDESGNATSVLYSNDGSYNFSPVLNTPSFERVEFEAGSSLGIPSLSLTNVVSVYPNPAKGEFTLALKLKSASYVSLNITDVMGREVRRWSEGNLTAGYHQLPIQMNNEEIGLYYISIQAGDLFSVIPVLLIH